MRVSCIIALITLCGLASANITGRFVDLRVDHFNPLDRRSYDARYYVNTEVYEDGGPIFIYLSGGYGVYDEFLNRGAVFEIAQDTRGIVFALEHRYYGESRPTEDASTANLQFLTVEQALADIAQFVAFIKENYSGTARSSVILWGRFYGGALAVWARQKYPNLVDGVWASSAIIDAPLEYPHFMRNVFYTINSIGGPECGQVMTDAFRMIEDSIRARDTSAIEQRMRLCSPIDLDIEEDVTNFYYRIAAEVGYSFILNSRYPEIDDKCTIMRGLDDPSNPPENALEGFARWFVDDFHRNTECLDYNYTAIMERYALTEWDSIHVLDGRRQNVWLQCTQLGQFAVANEGEGHPFGWRFDINFFRQWCARAFGEELFTQEFMEQSIARTNQFYGGLRPAVYRVFLTHGEMDPRRNLGPSEDLNDRSPVVVMSLQSAGRDFGSPADTDYAVLQQTKAQARDLIIQWIVDSSQELPPETTTINPDGTTSGPVPAIF